MTDARTSPLLGLVPAARLAGPSEVPGLVLQHAQELGAVDAVMYVVDCEQRVLVPVRHGQASDAEPIPVDTTLAGRCFRVLEPQETLSDEFRRVWLPLLDGVERVGVLELVFPPGEGGPVDSTMLLFAALVADLMITKGAYGDSFELARRRQPMSLAAEMAWQLLPPLTFGTERIVITGVLTPAYDVGGDSFDYAVDDDTARVAIFDAMGHGLDAGLVASVAVAAYRNSRRRLLDLPATMAAIDAAIASQFHPERFATAIVAELDLQTGHLCWALAGHPPPLLLRHGRVVKTLTADIGAPLGLGRLPVVAEESLEPGDQVLLFSDGVTEARDAAGDFFGVDRLADLVGRQSAAGTPPPETMRRLVQAILEHQAGELQDDATTVLVEWRGGGAQRILP